MALDATAAILSDAILAWNLIPPVPSSLPLYLIPAPSAMVTDNSFTDVKVIPSTTSTVVFGAYIFPSHKYPYLASPRGTLPSLISTFFPSICTEGFLTSLI